MKEELDFKAPKPKKSLSYIVRTKWNEYTVYTKGAKREAFYNSCIKTFKEYYSYPENYEPEDGDSVVNICLDAWNSICEYWGTPQFETLSINGQKARRMVEFTARSGAKPYDQRREEIDEEREAKGDLPIPDEEFLTLEKMKKVRAELTPEFNSSIDEPLSPRTQREIQRKNDLIVTVEARAPKKGKVILHPQETLAELVGVHEAVRFIKKRKVEDSHVVVGVPDGI
ncbi:hypothetical protein POM88_016491 [Heracleum sosnowskyi]|uniref:Uncharacterized protein n=1 Tax=Heracleum sosnowskyi TaxID=360622 RepID=A0AAD8INH5_9APIA|nr:hypothetical protein POM88_016491 [Heracleum sosnowskyi]